MPSTNTVTQYCVANGTTIVGGVTFTNPDDASAYLKQVNQQLESLGVTANVYIASVDTTTTTTDPAAYTAPGPETDDNVPEADTTTTDDTTVTPTVQTSDDTTPTTDTTPDDTPTA